MTARQQTDRQTDRQTNRQCDIYDIYLIVDGLPRPRPTDIVTTPPVVVTDAVVVAVAVGVVVAVVTVVWTGVLAANVREPRPRPGP